MSVEERLERLERQNKWMRRLGAVGVAFVAAVFLMGQGKDRNKNVRAYSVTANRVIAEEIVLRNLSGDAEHDSIWMYVDRGGQPRVLFRDAKGKPRTQFTIDAASFGNEHGVAVASIGVRGLRVGNPYTKRIGMKDGNAILAVSDSGTPRMAFLNKNKTLTWHTETTDEHLARAKDMADQAQDLVNSLSYDTWAGVATVGPPKAANFMDIEVAFKKELREPPKILACPLAEVAPDAFTVTIRSVGTKGFKLRVYRVDDTKPWTQDLRVFWVLIPWGGG